MIIVLGGDRLGCFLYRGEKDQEQFVQPTKGYTSPWEPEL